MSTKRRDGIPVLVENGTSTRLTRVDLSAGVGNSYDEAWLQDLLHQHPDILPVQEIEPGFGKAIAVCRELPLNFGAGKTGYLDNVLVTPSGGLVLLETKLWRNPDARRTVVAQAMEYSAAIFRMGYADFEKAIIYARKAAGETTATLYDLVGQSGELDEPSFVDAVTRNLRRGRAIVAVVGDGIREDILPLTELLQSHGGFRFVFALVELAVYLDPNDNRLIIPSILAQTTLIERGVISISDSVDQRVEVTSPRRDTTDTKPRRSFGLGEDEFYDQLDHLKPGISESLKHFLTRAADLAISVRFTPKRMMLDHLCADEKPLSVAAIGPDGVVDTGYVAMGGRREQARRYREQLARILGAPVELVADNSSAKGQSGTMPKLWDLLPAHEDAWLDAIRDYISEPSTNLNQSN